MGRFDDLPPEFRKLLILYGAFFVIAAVITIGLFIWWLSYAMDFQGYNALEVLSVIKRFAKNDVGFGIMETPLQEW